MSLRPSVISFTNPTPLRTLYRTSTICSSGLGRRMFSGSARLGEMPDHYDVLGVHHTASAKEIKRRFYELSKVHHPDLHPFDTEASARFIKLTNSYAVIGNAEKRAIYDRDYIRAHTGNQHGSPARTYHGAAGSRPASGLSKRRAQWKGPPPSYFRNETAAGANTRMGGSYGTSDRMPGYGFGTASGRYNDVPHFNFKRHEETHTRHQTRWQERAERLKAEAAARNRAEGYDSDGSGSGPVVVNSLGYSTKNGFFVTLFAISSILLMSTVMGGFAMGAAKKSVHNIRTKSQ